MGEMTRLLARVLLTEGKSKHVGAPDTLRLTLCRGETEDLGRFNFDFNFPSPAPPGEQDMENIDDEGFELPEMGLDPDPAPTPNVEDEDDANNTTGGFGLDVNVPPPASPSDSPNVLGGGLPDEEPLPLGPKQKKISRHGIPVPNLPSGVVRKMATQFARGRGGSKARISKPTLAAIEQATSWYFEQVGEDLAVYSKHAGRKTIDESDVTTLMKR